ncbi:hypothetical protein MBLNU459_g0200t1 [Dothideomycetes sp. NU459]
MSRHVVPKHVLASASAARLLTTARPSGHALVWAALRTHRPVSYALPPLRLWSSSSPAPASLLAGSRLVPPVGAAPSLRQQSIRPASHIRYQCISPLASQSAHLSTLRPGRRRWRSAYQHAARTRQKSEDSHTNAARPEASPRPPPTNTDPAPHQSQASSPHADGHAKHLLDRLPHLHRPTKEELLAAATGFWQRLGIRFKWFSIKSHRPFNTDDISAFVSWVVFGHIIWIVVGTTTFVSLAILAVNTVFAQETLAGWVGNYLTKSSGIKVVFESAIVPEWKGGVITFKNVFVSRRPGQGQSKVSKGSSATAAAAAAAAAHSSGVAVQEPEEDTNYTQYDVSIDSVNVTLSFTKWFNGKGLLKDVEIKGVRGVIDRTHVHPGDPSIDPRSYRHTHQTGDFEIDSFKLEDLLVTVYQPNHFRPFSVSIYSCDLPRLRKQWMFYDLLSANMMSGSFDDSLFTIHPRQTHNHTGLAVNEEIGDPTQWKKHSRLRMDGLKIDHLNRGVEGPLSWIHEGNVDLVADIMLPADQNGSIAKVMSDFYDRMEATITNGYLHTTHQHDTSDHHDDHVSEPRQDDDDDDKRFLIMDLRVHLNDVRAQVPIFNRDLSYVSNALIRPIVAFINSKRAFIPVNCRVVKRVSEFDGSWTIFDSGLLDDLSRETYEAFARDIVDDSARTRRLKKVGIWTLQLAAQALFIGLAGQLA